MSIKNPEKPKQTPEAKREAARRAITARWRDKTKPGPAALELIRDACAEGATVGNICAVLNISRDTFYRWKDMYPAFAEAIKEGRSIEHDRLVHQLVSMALAGSVPCLIYALKARHGMLDNQVNHVVENKVSVNFILPDALKPEDYLKTLTATAEIVKPDDVTRALAKPGVRGKVLRQLSRSEEMQHAE
jgi:hypothetical protein